VAREPLPPRGALELLPKAKKGESDPSLARRVFKAADGRPYRFSSSGRYHKPQCILCYDFHNCIRQANKPNPATGHASCAEHRLDNRWLQYAHEEGERPLQVGFQSRIGLGADLADLTELPVLRERVVGEIYLQTRVVKWTGKSVALQCTECAHHGMAIYAHTADTYVGALCARCALVALGDDHKSCQRF